MDSNIIIAIIGTITTIGGSIVTFIFTRRKQGAEVDSIAIVTAERADKINETLLNRVLQRLEHVEKENAELLVELKTIQNQNKELSRKMSAIAKILSVNEIVKSEKIRSIIEE